MTAFSFARVHRACSCGAFGSDVRTPCGVDLCWICAHAVGAHAAAASDPAAIAAAVAHCTCEAEAIYPPDVLRRRVC